MEPSPIQPDQKPAAQTDDAPDLSTPYWTEKTIQILAPPDEEILIRIITTNTGFYWTISVNENGKFVEPGCEQHLIGPFNSHEAALACAQDFIEDAVNGEQEQEII